MPNISSTAASTVSSPSSTELLNASLTKGDAKPLDSSVALSGNQSVNQAVENNIQEGAPESVETQTASQTKPPVPEEVPLSGASSAVILDQSSDSRNFIGTSIIGGVSSFKEKNGSPKIIGPKDHKATHSGYNSKKDEASEAAAIVKSKTGAGNSSTPTSSTPNVYAEIAAAGLISTQHQRSKVKDAVQVSDGTSAITEQAIATNMVNVQAEQASQGSTGKNRGPVLIAIDNFFGISVSPSTSASQGSLTVSLTGPNGESRTTTITTVNDGADVGSGSVAYTKDTTGARGQTDNTTGTISTNSGTKTNSEGTSVTAAEITKTDTGTRTTAAGRTINESGTKTDAGAIISDGGDSASIAVSKKKKHYTDSGDHLTMTSDQKKKEVSKSDGLQISSDQNTNQLNVNNQGIQDIEEVNNIQSIKKIMSSMQPQDRRTLTLGLTAVAAAVI